MYFLDALYGVISFNDIVNKCMLAPEVQRLREVRLCNINSLCITGSSNTNRFEHSVGTAYLAKINMETNYKYYFGNDQDAFIIAALLHDVANGPFGHSYEYIMERKGFVPEKGIADVIRKASDGTYKKNVKLEPIYFGKMNDLINILSEEQLTAIEAIMSGNHPFSKLISDNIDLDNIDNVFRMAYHMGIKFSREAPVVLAKSMLSIDNNIVFFQEAEPYLEEWYKTREQVYKFLLLNPQEFSGKYMLTEAMDIMFEYSTAQKHDNIFDDVKEIKWNYTDYELMLALQSLREVWLKRRILLSDKLNYESLSLFLEDRDGLAALFSKYAISLSKHFKLTHFVQDEAIEVIDKNITFIIDRRGCFKQVKMQYNVSQIVSRLMTGDLYDCLVIVKTGDTDKYKYFLDYENRIIIENDLVANLKQNFGLGSSVKVGLHPILDVNKTQRRIDTTIYQSQKRLLIGEPSKDLLIGVFLKNVQYGLGSTKRALLKNRDAIKEGVIQFFNDYFTGGAEVVPLYGEVSYFG